MRWLFFFFLATLATPAFAQAPARTKAVVPADYFTLGTVLGLAISPTGDNVAYIEARWDQVEDSRKSDLWIVSTRAKLPPIRLTADRANDRNPKWSADGKTVYFLGNRKLAGETKAPYDGTTQVWAIDATGAHLRAVTRVAGGIAGYDIAPTANQLFYTTDSSTTDSDAFQELRTRNAKLEYGHGIRKISDLHNVDLATWRSDKVLSPKRYIREFAVAANAKTVAMVTAVDDSVIRSEGESRVDVFDVESKSLSTPETTVYRAKAATPHAWLEDLTVNATGTKFAFCAIFDGHPAEVILGEKGGNGWNVKVGERTKSVMVRGYGSPIKWAGDLPYFLGEIQGRTIVLPLGANLPDDVATAKNIPDSIVTFFDITADGKAGVLLKGDSKSFPELFVSDWAAGAEQRKLTDINAHTASWKLPTVSHTTWKAADGSLVGGVLEMPPDHKAGEKLPLVVAIHGGPTTATKTEMSFDPHNGRLYFSAKGYAVLAPNYRGSTGYGDKFVTDLIGKENDIEVKDILAGIKHLIDNGTVDPNRVAVMGWSNGGYLTNCLITLKDSPVRIAAASSGAGIVDTVAEWGFNDEPAYPWVFKKGHPWEQPDLYKKTSPTYGLGNATTPTIIHVGGGDERCPPGHSRMLYRALKEYRQVPAELIVYPGEPHGLTKMSNRKAKMDWDLAWFGQYMK